MRASISIALEESYVTTLFGESTIVNAATNDQVVSGVRRQEQVGEVTLGKEVLRWVNVVGKHGQAFDDNGRWLLRTDPLWQPPGFSVTYQGRTLCGFGITYDPEETAMMGLRTAWVELHRLDDLDGLSSRGLVVFIESVFKACESQAVRVQGMLSKFTADSIEGNQERAKITFNPFNFADVSQLRRELLKYLGAAE